MVFLCAAVSERPVQKARIRELIAQTLLKSSELHSTRETQVRPVGPVSTIRSSNFMTPSRIQKSGNRFS